MQFVFWVPISNNANIPKHQCLGGYDLESQRVYLSADLVGGEVQHMVKDGTEMLFHKNHLYCPSDWLTDSADIIRIYSKIVLDLTMLSTAL